MRILFFNYEYPPLGGGAANATAYILREFAKIPDLEVDLVTSSIDDQYHLEEIGNSIKIHRLPIGKNKNNLHFQSQKDLLVYSWRAYAFAKKLIAENEYALSHSFFTVPCGFISMQLKRKFALPYIVSLRGSDVPGYSDRFDFIYKFLTPIIKIIWNKAAFVVSNSEGLKELALQTRTKKEIGIIYNGVDVDHFRPDAALRSQKNFIITTGASRVTHRKGLNYLIEAVAQLAPRYPQILVKIMGEGNAQSDLEKLVDKLQIRDHVEFIGRIPREKTAPFYQEASVFVLPSLNEGMSNAMLEALSSGLPLISTDTGGAAELIKKDSNGFIIEMKNPTDIAAKIELLINDRDLRDSMSQKSREIAETMSWTNVAAQYFDLYKKIK